MRNAVLLAVVVCMMLWAGPASAQSRAATLSTQDHVDIQQLYARYNTAIDAGNAEAWADTFTPDGTFNERYRNREGLIDFIHRWVGQMNGANRRHWNNNIVLTPTADGASATAYLMLLDVGVKPPVIAGVSKYTDVLVRTAQGWRFKSRVVKADPQ